MGGDRCSSDVADAKVLRSAAWEKSRCAVGGRQRASGPSRVIRARAVGIVRNEKAPWAGGSSFSAVVISKGSPQTSSAAGRPGRWSSQRVRSKRSVAFSCQWVMDVVVRWAETRRCWAPGSMGSIRWRASLRSRTGSVTGILEGSPPGTAKPPREREGSSLRMRWAQPRR